MDEKRTYEEPEIVEYGDVAELTKQSSGSNDDGGGGFTFSGVAN